MGGDVGAGGGGDCLVGPVDCRHLHLHLDAMGQPIEAAGSRETAGGGEEVREGLEADGGGVPCKEAESVRDESAKRTGERRGRRRGRGRG
eukprot:763238-Hanusia_phi.AAC.2